MDKKGIHFDPVKHIYTNSNQERYISGTKFIGLFKPKFESNFWSTVKCYEDCFVGVELNEKEINKLNKWRKKAGWRDISKEKLQEFDLWKFIKAMKMNEVDNKVIIDYCNTKSIELGKVIDLNSAIVDMKKQWKKKSDDSLKKGTKFHDGEEHRVRKENNFTHDWNWLDISYPNLEPNTYPELRLYNHEHKIAGSADVTKIFKNGSIFIEDFKTNKQLDFDSFTNPYTKKKDNMLYVCSGLPNCSFSHYTLQLSLYGWMMEQLGYKVSKLTILHIIFDENDEPIKRVPYNCEYMKHTIINMIDYYESYLK